MTGPSCPCGTGKPFDLCCGPLIDGERRAERAEELMRARYTAHVRGEIGFILASHHPATRSDIDETATARWASESEWLGFELVAAEGGGAGDERARIEFMARFRDAARRRQTHHEIALFERYHGQWYFRDAEVPNVAQVRRGTPKQGRNEPCACGSGLKHKRCCGSAA